MDQGQLPDWIGAIGGAIGAVGGIAGTWIALVSLRRTNEHKGIDLRVEVRRQEATVGSDVNALHELLGEAKRSHLAVLSAQGRASSAPGWLENFSADQARLIALSRDTEAAFLESVDRLSNQQLEDRLIRAHKFKRKADDMSKKYGDILSQDDQARARISAQLNAARRG